MAQNTKGKYQNLRYKLIRGLISYERFQRTRHWEKQSAEWTSKAIVSLDFAIESIKSVRQAVQLDGIGAVIASKLKDISKEARYSSQHPEQGKFVSSAPALLVALYMLQRDIGVNDILDGAKVLIPEVQLRQVARVLSEEKFLKEKEDTDTGFCQAWWRLTVLANRGLVKKRTRNKLPVYELLPPGEALAQQLLAAACLEEVTLSQLMTGQIDWTERCVPQDPGTRPNPADDHLYTNDDGSDGLVLYVDTREWGGDRLGLNALCRTLAESNMRYSTCHLATGDYSWVWTCGGQKLELPVLVERKRADDLAESIKDGRYGRQKEKMLKWRQKYDALPLEASLMYVVEGEAAPYVVRCADGCQGVGKCGNPTVDQVQAKIDELDTSADFNLVQTPHSRGTIDLLVAITRDLQERINVGDFFGLLARLEDLEKAADNNAVHSKPSKAGRTQKNPAKTTKKGTAKGGRAVKGGPPEDPPVWQEDVELRDLQAEVTKKRRKKREKITDMGHVHCDTGSEMGMKPYPSLNEDLLRSQDFVDVKPVMGFEAYGRDLYAASVSEDLKPDLKPEPSYKSVAPMKSDVASVSAQTGRSSPLVPHNFSSRFSTKRESPVASGSTLVHQSSPKKKRRVHEINMDWLDSDDLPDIGTPDDTDIKPPSQTQHRQRWYSEPTASTSSSSIFPSPRHEQTYIKPEPGTSQYEGLGRVKLETGEAGGISENVPPEVDTVSSDVDSVEDIRDRDWTDELRQIRRVLPETNEILAKTFLEVHKGNVDMAVSALLDSGM